MVRQCIWICSLACRNWQRPWKSVGPSLHVQRKRQHLGVKLHVIITLKIKFLDTWTFPSKQKNIFCLCLFSSNRWTFVKLGMSSEAIHRTFHFIAISNTNMEAIKLPNWGWEQYHIR
jgi:hypothetical protein